jgi:SAM-dependent methyltransferase
MNQPPDQEQALVERMRCPRCGGALRYDPPADGGEGHATCRECATGYAPVTGIWRMLTADEETRYRPFLAQYQPLRQREGWERDQAAYYLALPQVPPTDPAAAIWRIRRRSFDRLRQVIRPEAGQWALDLGAGHGWLARYLAQWGYRPVAVDLNVAGPDSLAGARVYLEQAGVWFGRVQVSMERPPFAAATFALCTVSGALHYADLRPTLAAIARLLAPGGRLIITDSPVYTTAAAGQAMVRERSAAARAQFGAAPEWPGGTGFLVQSALLDALRREGFAVRMHSIERPLGLVKRWVRRRLRPGQREEARFPLIIGQKSG